MQGPAVYDASHSLETHFGFGGVEHGDEASLPPSALHATTGTAASGGSELNGLSNVVLLSLTTSCLPSVVAPSGSGVLPVSSSPHDAARITDPAKATVATTTKIRSRVHIAPQP